MRRSIFFLFFVILSFNLVIAADVKVNLEADNLNPINGQQVTVNVLIESDDVDYPFEILSPYILIESSDKENLILDLNGALGLDGNIYDSLLQNKVHSGFVSNGKSYVWKMGGKVIVNPVTEDNNLLGSFKFNSLGDDEVTFSIKTPQSKIKKADETLYNVDFSDILVFNEGAACVPGDTLCVGPQIKTCQEDGTFIGPVDCPDGQTCQGNVCADVALECNPVAATCGNTGISCIDGVAIEKPIENCALGFVCEEEVCVEHCASNDGCPEGSVCTWENKCLINEDSDFLNYFIDFEQLYGEEIQNAQTNGWNIKMVSRLANFFKLIFT